MIVMNETEFALLLLYYCLEKKNLILPYLLIFTTIYKRRANLLSNTYTRAPTVSTCQSTCQSTKKS